MTQHVTFKSEEDNLCYPMGSRKGRKEYDKEQNTK